MREDCSMLKQFIVLLSIISAACSNASAANWYVATNVSGAGDGTSWAMAFTNFQHAINTAGNGDNIYLAAHVFPQTNATAVNSLYVWTNKSLHIHGGFAGSGTPGELADPPTTMLMKPWSLTANHRILYMANVTNASLSRVAIAAGSLPYNSSHPPDYYSGGILMLNCSNVVFSTLTVVSNSSSASLTNFGGAIYARDSWVLMTNSTIAMNTMGRNSSNGMMYRGAGLYIHGGGWIIRDTVFKGNRFSGSVPWWSAQGGGNALYITGGVHEVKNSLFVHNPSDLDYHIYANALWVISATVGVDNCTFYGHPNSSIGASASDLNISNSIIWRSTNSVSGTVTLYSCNVQDGSGAGSNGNFSRNPLFERGVYLASNSPCVDAGSVTAEAAGLSGRTTRSDGVPDSGQVDIGFHYPNGVSDYFVSTTDGSDDNDGTSWAAPFKTISRAASALEDGGLIFVAAGEYAGASESIPISLSAKLACGLIGTNAETTVLNMTNVTGQPLVMNYCFPTSRVENFTISNARFDTPRGNYGGAFRAAYSELAVKGLRIMNYRSIPQNTSAFYDGAAVMAYCNGTITDLTIKRSYVSVGVQAKSYGAGISVAYGNIFFDRCLVLLCTNYNTRSDYDASLYGAGMGIYGGTHEIRNSLFAVNEAKSPRLTGFTGGDGIYIGGATATIDNCTFASNMGEGLYGSGAITARNSIFWSNGQDVTGSTAFVYCNVQNGATNIDSGCISADPLFVDAALLNFRLNPGSPSLNTGTNQAWMIGAFDLDGEQRIYKGFVDMGAYELPPPRGAVLSLR